MVSWSGVPPVTWISPSRAFRADRAALATASKVFIPCTALALALAPATETYESPTRTFTVRLLLESSVTNAPEPGPDTEAAARVPTVCALAGLTVPVPRTDPERTDVAPLTASLCQVPTEANGLSKVAEK